MAVFGFTYDCCHVCASRTRGALSPVPGTSGPQWHKLRHARRLSAPINHKPKNAWVFLWQFLGSRLTVVTSLPQGREGHSPPPLAQRDPPRPKHTACAPFKRPPINHKTKRCPVLMAIFGLRMTVATSVPQGREGHSPPVPGTARPAVAQTHGMRAV